MLSKIVDWILSLTKLDRIVTPVQAFLDGKKSYLAGAAIIIPALVTILQNFSAHGVGYLTGITATPEYLAFLNGLAVMGIRAAIAKS